MPASPNNATETAAKWEPIFAPDNISITSVLPTLGAMETQLSEVSTPAS